jgi:hypothetical protein
MDMKGVIPTREETMLDVAFKDHQNAYKKIASDGEDHLTDTEKDFKDKGLNTNKKIKSYDCYDETTTPE